MLAAAKGDLNLRRSCSLGSRARVRRRSTIAHSRPSSGRGGWGDVLPPIPSIPGWDKKDPAKLAELGREQRNIEGIAAIDGRLYAGLRTPNCDREVVIVSAPVEELFAEGSPSLPGS